MKHIVEIIFYLNIENQSDINKIKSLKNKVLKSKDTIQFALRTIERVAPNVDYHCNVHKNGARITKSIHNLTLKEVDLRIEIKFQGKLQNTPHRLW